MTRTHNFRGLIEYPASSLPRHWVYYTVGAKPALVHARWIVEDLESTGLKDKNGKEIYEGDIIQSAHPLREALILTVVCWKEAGFNIRRNSLFDDTAEVIGNVYENPELLEAGK